MRKKLYFSLLSVLLISACTRPSTSNPSNQPVPILPIQEVEPTLIATDVPQEKSQLRLSSFASSVETIVLGTTKYGAPESLFKIVFSDDKDFLLLDAAQKRIYRYDSAGHFLNLINRPDIVPQLANPVDIAYNPYNQHLFVLDNSLNMILEYTLSGDRVRTKMPLPFGAVRIGFVDENHYCFYSNYSSEESASGYNYHITDTLFNEVGRFEPCTPTKDSRIGFTQIFTYDGKRLIGKSPASNYLYHITADSISPLYQVELNGDEKWLSEKDADSLYEKRVNHQMNYCDRVFFADHYVITHYLIASNEGILYPKTIIYDRLTKETLSGDEFVCDLPGAEYEYFTSYHDNALYNFKHARNKQSNATIIVTHLK